jgi:hypothetical protein
MGMSFTDNSWSDLDYFDIPQETKVATFGAGFTINYGRFKKRIANQEILIYGNWADPIAAPELITGIKIDQKLDMNSYKILYQNYPNPFNSYTKIIYSLPEESFITLKIYSVLGQEIAELVSETKPPGNYEVEFNAEDFSSGVYIYQLKAGNFIESKKMVLIK